MIHPLKFGASDPNQKPYTGSKGSTVLSAILQSYPPLTQEAVDEFFLTQKGSEEESKAADKLDLFLSHNANPNQVTSDQERRAGSIALGLNYGVKPLAKAIEYDRPVLLEKLLAHRNIEVNGLGVEGSSPLDMALSKGNKDAFVSLYQRLTPAERLAKTFMPRLKEGYGAQKGKMFYSFPGCYSVSKDVFETMDRETRRAKYGTPVLVKALRTNPAIFHWLLTQPEAAELVSQKDAFGTTALNAAIQTGQPKSTIEQLLKLGADPLSSDIAGYNPIKWSMYSGQKEVLDLLLAQDVVKAKIKPEQAEAFKQVCQKEHDALKYSPIDQYTSQNKKNHELVLRAVGVQRYQDEPRKIIPYLALGADINASDFEREPGYKGGHGRPIDFAYNNPKFELILTAAGVNITDYKKNKEYYQTLINKYTGKGKPAK